MSKNKYEKIHHYKIHRRHPNRSLGGDIAINIFLFLLGFVFLIPIIYAITNSLKPLSELFRFPPTLFVVKNPTFNNFSDLFVTMGQSWVPFSRYLFNTVFLTVVGTVGHIFIASMAAYVLAKYDFPGGKFFFSLIVTTLMFSGYITGIPNYIIQCRLHMIDTYWALLIPAFAAPIGLYLMKQFMVNIPDSLIEAAKIDGANEWTIFINLIMPNVKPAWLTMMIFSVQSLWNNSASTVIYTESKKTLVYALSQITVNNIARTGQAAAVTVITMIVPLALYILSQSQIMETMATSGLKD
ncbi:MAG: carbohydrate ABC transporter permease [Treponema sp.]